MDHIAIISQAKAAAHQIGQQYLDKYHDGQDSGSCGFAWVNVIPQHKGNTKAGRAERKVLRDMGFELDWTGKRFMIWNPSGLSCQNVTAKYFGALAAAETLASYGFRAFAQSRLD